MAGKIKEKVLLKALGELEDLAEQTMSKGDKLEEADTEGGMSTEGKPLSSKSPSGRGGGEAKKSKKEKKDLSKMLSASDVGDDNSSEYASEMKKKAKKALPPPDESSAEESDNDTSGDEESDDDEADAMSKSLSEAAREDETMRKAIDVSDFLEGLIDQNSAALTRIEKSLSTKLITKIEKSFGEQGEFNTRLARGLVAVGNLVKSLVEKLDEQAEVIKSFADAPATGAPRGKALLNKSDVAPSPVGEEQNDDIRKALSPNAVVDWMLQKGVDPAYVTRYELNHYNIGALPPDMQKAITHDLVK